MMRLNPAAAILVTLTVALCGCGGGGSGSASGAPAAPTSAQQPAAAAETTDGTDAADTGPSPTNQPLTAPDDAEVQLSDWGQITFRHALKPVVAAGECPFPQVAFDEPVADVWTHPDDSVLFVGFGESHIVNVRRFDMIASGDPNIGPVLEPSTPGAVLGAADELLVDPDDTEVIYARIDRRDLALSRDGGRVFETVDQPGYGTEIDDLAVTGGAAGYLWAVNATGIYRAAKRTRSFARVLAFEEILLSGGYSIAVHPNRPERLLVTGADGTYRTPDAGETWTRMADAPGPGLRTDPHDPDRVYTEAGSSIYLSEDFGDSWHHTGFHGFANEVLVADPFRAGRLYIAPWDTFVGLRVSDAEGADFRLVDEVPERVHGLAFSSTGALFAGQGNRVVCRPLFEVPDFDPDHPLQADVRFQDPATGAPVAEHAVDMPLAARLFVQNRSGRDLRDVRLGVWLEAPSGRQQVYADPAALVPSGGLVAEFDLPPLSHPGRHRLVATADLPDEAPAGGLAWAAGVAEAPPPTEPAEYAELSWTTLWLNYAHPWFPITTEVGEQRRMVFDVRNQGPDTSRNVVVQIATGSLVRIDDYGPVLSGQTLDCLESAEALTCRVGDLAAGAVYSLELYVTPLRTISGVAASVTSDTSTRGTLSGGLDLVTMLEGPESFSPDQPLEYVVTVTNAGDEQAANYRFHGAIGPWPGVASAHLLSFSDSRCQLDDPTASDAEPLTYWCGGDFLEPGESRRYTIRLSAPQATSVHHVVEGLGFPDSFSSYWFELFRGNNVRGLLSERAR